MNNQEYWTEIKDTASLIIWSAINEYDSDKTRDSINDLIYDNVLPNCIENHQWVIYYGYNLDVIKHTDNLDYMSDNMGDDMLAESLRTGGLSGLHQALCYWSMYADVMEYITDEAIDKELKVYCEEHTNEHN